MPRTIRVYNLATGAYRLYVGITAAEAVVNAYEQSRGNYHWWLYDYNQAQKTLSGKCVTCGDWTTIL